MESKWPMRFGGGWSTLIILWQYDRIPRVGTSRKKTTLKKDKILRKIGDLILWYVNSGAIRNAFIDGGEGSSKQNQNARPITGRKVVPSLKLLVLRKTRNFSKNKKKHIFHTFFRGKLAVKFHFWRCKFNFWWFWVAQWGHDFSCYQLEP